MISPNPTTEDEELKSTIGREITDVMAALAQPASY